MGCRSVCRENDKGAVRYKVCEVEVDCPEEGRKKDDWTKPMRSAMSLMVLESRSDIFQLVWKVKLWLSWWKTLL